ncbi:hypothetical protein N7449_000759 [Penicillium cf. viridicatum]|uniref:Uncharacterized protein n=1 Tax=Penicillium cf. viridicatum TaxID=2972119 RepID=A0A9W9T9K7_9EURO|nr:hypothetical protein N7449_000759 [Penicillium cf. viridicatum]
MTPSASLETFLLHCGTFIGERLEAAPFQTFLILASVWISSDNPLLALKFQECQTSTAMSLVREHRCYGDSCRALDSNPEEEGLSHGVQNAT